MKYYFRRVSEFEFGFGIEGITDVLPTDIPIPEKDYQRFFELQGEGKQFKVKANPTGESLFDLIEEFTPEPILQGPTPEERLAALEAALMGVL